MTLTNTVVAKLAVAFVAISMVFMLVAPAKAQTAAELQATIDSLMAQIAALNAQVGGSATSGASVCPYTWTRSLSSGSTGADVKALQQFLNASADTQVAAAGKVGSAGMETEYFGPATAAAVSNFQVKYRTDILSPAGLVNPTGYFGPATMAKANMLCAAAMPDDGGDDSTDDGDDDSTDDSDTDLSGEASLDTYEIKDGEDADEAEEGKEDVVVGEINLEFADGDAMVNRMDIALQVDSGNDGDDDPWDVFEEVSLWVDGDEVGRIDATDEDNYLDEDNGSLRFSGLDFVAMEDEEVVVEVAVTVQGSIDGISNGESWNIAGGPVRYTDADDVTTTEGSTGDQQAMDGTYSGALAEFDIEEAGSGDDLDLESSDADPDATTIELDEDDNTEAAIFAFDLSAEDSDGDIDLNEVEVQVFVTGAGTSVDTLINDMRLEIDGDSFDAESYTGTGSSSAVTFDIDGDVTVAADEVVTATLYVDFENMDDDNLEGSGVYATTSAAGIDAEGVEDVTVDGTGVTGETHTLRTEGVSVEYSDDTVVDIENDDTSSTDDQAKFTLEFDVTSFGDDVYLPFGAASTSVLTDGVKYSIINTNTNAVVTTGTTIASLDMDDDGETNSFKVADGDTNTFTLEVTYSPTASGSYKLRLDAINFATSDAATATEAQDVSDQNIDTAATQITS